jgi:hypothetical protein
VIAATHPDSLQDLADRTGRKTSNLSRTLKTMERYGFVRLHRGTRGKIRPEVPYRTISLTLALGGGGVGELSAANVFSLPADLASELERKFFWWEHVGTQPRSHLRILAQAMNFASLEDVLRLETALILRVVIQYARPTR